ncbi:MAG TPA: tRNA pseudouridine(38-40) synthase TruA [Bdellovibrionota bacterium]|nr:tRNA pseudouridine(38-40) synthase TruA [Bdellovibrionota bacterium]
MRKYAALISYAGTNYVGWQKQKGSAAAKGPATQEVFETALSKIVGEKVSSVGSGRTDSGVHATGQVVHFVLKRKEWDPEILRKGLNSQLGQDIRAIAVAEVPLEFHAQRSAVRKQYSFYFQQGPCALPHLEPYTWWIRKKLDLAAMNEALGYFRGEHDFKPFQASGARPGPTVRTVIEAEAVVEPIAFPGVDSGAFGLVRVRLIGTGFLKQMVRGLAGTLLQIGEGRREATCIRDLLRSLDRSAVGPTAPGRALWLERVWYDPDPFGRTP